MKMEYQKIIILLDNKPNHLQKFRTKIWVEMNDDARGTYSSNSQIEFRSTMLKSTLFDYRYAYILFKGTMNINGQGENEASKTADRNNKQTLFKNCIPVTDCKSEINNTQIYNVIDLDVVIIMYNQTEYSDDYAKVSSLWQYYSAELANKITDSKSFKVKSRIIDKTDNTGTVNIKIAF